MIFPFQEELKSIVKNKGKKISAAVFPYPEMSKEMVLQDWSSWELDIVCPMNYHHFYNGNIRWIADSVSRGIKYKKSYYQDRDIKPTEDLLFTITLFPLTTLEHNADDLVN